MSEIIPPSKPGKEPPKPVSERVYYHNKPPNKKLCTLLGFVLFIISGVLAAAFPPLALAGLVVAIGSLFFQGYRCIFIGYLLALGLLLLGIIIYCSSHPFRID